MQLKLKDIYTITASAGTGGTITPSGAVSVFDGSSQSFTVMADSGYEIADVKVDGASVGAQTSHTFSNVTATHTIAATFSSTGPSLIYDISTAAQLMELAKKVNGGDAAWATRSYRLTQDIDLSGIPSWTPIGTVDTKDFNNRKPFKGTFDGNGKTISNLKIDAPIKDDQGLFGYAEGATIQNLTLTNCDVIGNDYVGGIAGWASGSRLANCSASGVVKGNYEVGGIVGIANQLTTRNIGSSMVNCTNACAVTGKTDCVGGLAGNFTGDNSWMANCRNSGEVSGTSYVGCIVGSFNNTEATIRNCYNVESILASKQSGGIAGWNSAGSNGYYGTEPGLGSIAYCYSQTHTVSNVEPPVGSADNYKQGALVGENFYTYSNGKNLPGVLTGCGTFATASGNITPVNDYVGKAQQTSFTNPYVSGTTTILVNALNSWARSPEGGAAGANFWVLDGNGNPAPVLTSDPGSAYFADAAWYLRKENIMKGIGETTFSGGEKLNRQQSWMILSRVDGQAPPSMAAAKAWAVSANVSDGSNAGGIVSRQQLAVMLYRAAGSPAVTENKLKDFSDGSAVAAYAKDAMNWTLEAGILTGNGGKLNAADPASRANAAVMFTRYLNVVQK